MLRGAARHNEGRNFMTHPRSGRRALAALFAVTMALAIGPASAQAGPITSLTAGCSGQVLEQPFVRWLDPLRYVAVPGGSFEGAAGGWAFAGGAKVVAGNEPFYVRGKGDGRSLWLPPGSSATTGQICVGLLHPTLRLFATNSAPLLSTLKVEVLFRDLAGTPRALPVGLVVAGTSWQPTLPMVYLMNVTGSVLSQNGTAMVAFRFTPVGRAGYWRIDDVYVDPFKGR
jgi:hypothetical protein